MNLLVWGGHYCKSSYVPGPCRGHPEQHDVESVLYGFLNNNISFQIYVHSHNSLHSCLLLSSFFFFLLLIQVFRSSSFSLHLSEYSFWPSIVLAQQSQVSESIELLSEVFWTYLYFYIVFSVSISTWLRWTKSCFCKRLKCWVSGASNRLERLSGQWVFLNGNTY